MNIATPALAQQNAKPAIIAGRHAGKPIYCVPEVHPIFLALEKAGREGSHWARVAIKELGSLTTGHINKNHIFVDESPHLRRTVSQFYNKESPYVKHSVTLFYAFLPGLEATIAPQPDGRYLVVALKMDGRYFEATEKERHGLYHASRYENRWSVKYSERGQPTMEKNRTVAITDSGPDSPADAATAMAPQLVAMLGPAKENELNRDGFDFHFTPGQRRLGGLINYNALTTKSVHGSSVLLANTMYSARNIVGVNWVAERGGSTILTQAMKVLAARRATLKGHSIYLYKPTTSPGDATRLAHQLKLTLPKEMVKTGFDFVGGLSQSRVARTRLRNVEDPYNGQAHLKATMLGLGKVTTVAGLGVVAGSSLGMAFPAIAAVTSVVAKATAISSAVLGAGAVAQHVIEPHANKFTPKRVAKG